MPIRTEADALETVIRLADTQANPVLPDDRPLAIVRALALATVWTASTEYLLGARVVPLANFTGRIYRAIAFDGDGVSSATTEPEWPSSRDSKILDGNVTWQEDGLDTGDLYDIRGAIHQLWLEKAAVATSKIDFTADNQSLTRSQLHEHCLAMAQQYRPIRIA